MANSFDQFIFEHQSGELNQELTREMNALTAALQKRAEESGKAKGEITLKISFELESNGLVAINAEAKVKAPGPRKTKEIRWIDKNGRMVSEDPRQTVMQLTSRKKEHTS